MNRRRYKRKEEPAKETGQEPEEERTGEEDFMEHLDFMISLTEGKGVGKERIRGVYEKFFKKWRQRSLSFWQKWCKLPDE